MQSPLLVGNDLNQISSETLEIISNKDVIALNQSSFVYQARRVVDYGDLEIWARPLISIMSGEIAVALLNRSDQAATITFDLKSVGLDATKEYTMTDLWSKELFSASTKTEISRTIPAHGIVVLKIIGTSLPYNVFQYKDVK